MNKLERPKFNPVHDDYWLADLEDGSYLEYASTKQFGELFDYADQQDKQIKELKDLLVTIRKKLDVLADWGGGGNWITELIETIEQALK